MGISPSDSPVRLSRREQEVAGLVAEGLTNREIAKRLFISERTVDGHLEHVREKLAVNTRAQIAAWVVRQHTVRIVAAPAEADRHNLPAVLTSFVGRDKELPFLARLLGTSRLVTVTGSGGCGKTRLSIETARTQLDRYPGGIYLVELAPVSDPEEVAMQMATALKLRPQGGQSAGAAVIDYLRVGPLLLLLDNCEHVLTGCRDLVSAVLERCPDTIVLATSREPLGLAGETVFRVPGLAVPDDPGTFDPADEGAAARLAEVASVRLFLERAQKADPLWSPGPDELISVAEVCRRLEGIPLAIELVAPRVSALNATELATQLHTSFSLVRGVAASPLSRQATLDATISWSYRLLDSESRKLLCSMAVFNGPTRLEAIEAVHRPLAGEQDVLSILVGLVDKSLVERQPTPAGSRYRLLESVRHFGLSRLYDAGDLERTRDAHRDYYATRAAELEALSDSGAFATARFEVSADLDNFRAAVDRAASRGPESCLVELVAHLCKVQGFFSMLSSEWLRWVDAALATNPATSRFARLDLLILRMNETYFLGTNEPLYREALALADKLDDSHRRGRAMVFYANCLFFGERKPSRALSLMEEALPLLAGDLPIWRATAYQYFGYLLSLSGDYNKAVSALEQSLTFRLPIDSITHECLGLLDWERGNLQAARHHWRLAIEAAEQGADWWGGVWAHMDLALDEMHSGNLDQALALAREAEAVMRRVGHVELAHGFCVIALILLRKGDHAAARRLVEDALERAQGLGDYGNAWPEFTLGELLEAEGDVAGAQRHLKIAYDMSAGLDRLLQIMCQEALDRVERRIGGESSSTLVSRT